MRRRIKKIGLLKVVSQMIFIIFDKIYLSRISKSKIKKILTETEKPIVKSINVNNINSKEVEELIKKIDPCLIVVSGVSIIKQNILSLAKTFINIHCGITLKYRGVHGGFWAIYNRDFDNIGVTIHLIDRGVDTGLILYQDRITVDKKLDNFRTIVAKQYLKGADLMIKAVNDALNNNLKPLKVSDQNSYLWYHPTIIEYLKWLKIFKNELP